MWAELPTPRGRIRALQHKIQMKLPYSLRTLGGVLLVPCVMIGCLNLGQTGLLPARTLRALNTRQITCVMLRAKRTSTVTSTQSVPARPPEKLPARPSEARLG